MDQSNEVCYYKNKKEDEECLTPLIIHDEENILDNLIESQKLSWEHYKIISLLILYIMGEGFVMIGVSLLVPVVSEYWKLTELQKGLLGGSGFLGFTIGAISSGLISDTQGRRLSFILGNILSFIGAAIGYVLCYKLEALVVSNILIGLGIGISVPAIISLCSEITPSRQRSIIMGTIWTVFVFGEILGCLLAIKYEMYQYETGNWKKLLLFRSLSVSKYKNYSLIYYLFFFY